MVRKKNYQPGKGFSKSLLAIVLLLTLFSFSGPATSVQVVQYTRQTSWVAKSITRSGETTCHPQAPGRTFVNPVIKFPATGRYNVHDRLATTHWTECKNHVRPVNSILFYQLKSIPKGSDDEPARLA